MSQTPRRAGRPAKYGQPLTPAQRVKQCRERAQIRQAMRQQSAMLKGM